MIRIYFSDNEGPEVKHVDNLFCVGWNFVYSSFRVKTALHSTKIGGCFVEMLVFWQKQAAITIMLTQWWFTCLEAFDLIRNGTNLMQHHPLWWLVTSLKTNAISWINVNLSFSVHVVDVVSNYFHCHKSGFANKLVLISKCLPCLLQFCARNSILEVK